MECAAWVRECTSLPSRPGLVARPTKSESTTVHMTTEGVDHATVPLSEYPPCRNPALLHLVDYVRLANAEGSPTWK